MVCIRLAREGAKKKPTYRVVAADSRKSRDGRFIEQIGHYDPRTKRFHLDDARYDHWVSVGARPSVTVSDLVKKTRRAAKAA